MMLSTLLLLFGAGMWAPGLEAVNIDVFPEYKISPIEKSWKIQKKIPSFTARSVLLVDENSMVNLYSYNANLRLPMASLTKLMTALLIVENHDLNEIVLISKASSVTEGSTMNLQNGEMLTVQKLLKGLLMNSGNDAAIALAEYHSGTVYEFVSLMNIRAHELFLFNTNFVNPHGLDSSVHYASSRDLVVLAKQLWQYKEIQKIVDTQLDTVISEVSDDGTQTEHILKNTNKLLGTFFQVHGMKTGTTPNAGQCLMLVVEKNNKFYFLVILGSEDRYQDARNILYELLGE
ncbi:TPA: D-alanyl-D-alanine carboxypeptidase [Candidatus Gracilibacteria bacterium]|nr:D-alanyl-D-alanine carboxypeptidase [Candidatus Peregrinibacteria bacterium]HIQ56932.1 D-alanyl-D-alanine carboxypeptidase [Candidatus Gracilibacteria bacterium]HIQ57511.1 D-alanyl-D-alanine carboxypeptidase [Candidatus Gracilibacteria bacterium]